MPYLKYKCKDCDNIFEELVSGDETILCPICDGESQRYYPGKCNFGSKGSPSDCSGSCSGCSGCK